MKSSNNMEYTSEIHKFKSDSLTLRGRLCIHPKNSIRPLILCFHGASKSGRERYETLQNDLEVVGYNSFVFDFRGTNTSEGTFVDGSLVNRLRDAEAAYSFLQSHVGTTEKDLIIIGSSMGGHVACRFAQLHPKIAKLILLYPAAYSQLAESLPLNSEFTHEIRKPNSWIHSPAFTALRYYPGDVRIIFGEDDEIIPKAVQQKYFSLIQPENRIVIPHGKHTLLNSQTTDEKITYEKTRNEIVEFLTRPSL